MEARSAAEERPGREPLRWRLWALVPIVLLVVAVLVEPDAEDAEVVGRDGCSNEAGLRRLESHRSNLDTAHDLFESDPAVQHGIISVESKKLWIAKGSFCEP